MLYFFLHLHKIVQFPPLGSIILDVSPRRGDPEHGGEVGEGGGGGGGGELHQRGLQDLDLLGGWHYQAGRGDGTFIQSN